MREKLKGIDLKGEKVFDNVIIEIIGIEVIDTKEVKPWQNL